MTEDKSKLGIHSVAPMIDDLDHQEGVNRSIKAMTRKAREHILTMHFTDCDILSRESACMRSADDPEYVAPTKAQVSAVVDYVVSMGYTRTELSKILGVTSAKNRTINYWCRAAEGERVIPHAAWVMLTQLAGLRLVTMLERKNNDEKK